jgi:hypothetical protein
MGTSVPTYKAGIPSLDSPTPQFTTSHSHSESFSLNLPRGTLISPKNMLFRLVSAVTALIILANPLVMAYCIINNANIKIDMVMLGSAGFLDLGTGWSKMITTGTYQCCNWEEGDCNPTGTQTGYVSGTLTCGVLSIGVTAMAGELSYAVSVCC